MKKLFLLLLCALLALCPACSKGAVTEDTASDEAAPAENVSASTEETAPEANDAADVPAEGAETKGLPENVEVSPILELELAKPAEIINGTIVLYFTDEELFYASDAPCSIGLISSAMADSISGTLDMTSYPDMFSGDDYRGAAIIPSEPIPAGSYTFSVSIGTYLVSFDMTVE